LRRTEFDRFCTAVYLRLSHHKDMMGLEPLAAGYEDLLDEFLHVRTSKDSADLAERILARWLRQNPTEQAPASSSSVNGTKEPGQSAGEADDEADDEPSVDGAPDSGDDQQDDDHTDGEADVSAAADQQAGFSDEETPGADDHDDATGPGAQTGDKSDEPDEQAGGHGGVVSGGIGATTLLGEALTEAIGEIAASAPGDYRVFTKQHDRVGIVPAAGEPQIKALLETGKDEVRRLRRGLANVLRSAEKRWWREDQARGVLSPRTLHRLCTDRSELNVFRTRSMVQGQSTAVSIVLDASGSMTTRKMVVVRESTRVLLEALADLKIPTEAFTFTTGNACCLNDAVEATGEDMTTLQQRFARFANLEISLIKQFGEPVKAALSRLPSIRGTGLTPLSEAMQIGAMRLLPRPETRKVMLVLTDGRPGCEGSEEAAMAHAQRVAGMITSAGIELIGVAVQDDALREIVADTIFVHELKDLPAQLCKLLGRTLQKGLRHVG
jgi:cobalamin biosynthesis protein CobT